MQQQSGSLMQNWAALLAVSLGIFAITLDGSMMPVAIGSIVNDFQSQLGFVQAAMALHSLVMAAMYFSAGKLGDRMGQKRIFLFGAIIFASGTLLAAFSPSIWILLLGWSLIKPIGGAMMIPAASSIIVINYQGPQRNTAFGIFSAFVAAAAVIGPVWMGFIANTISWRWAFASESILILTLVYFASMVTESELNKSAKFDWLGALLAFIGLGLIVLGATLAGEFGWWSARRPFYIGEANFSPYGLSAAIVFMLSGGVVLIIFAISSVIQQRRGGAPLFDVGLFRNKLFSLGMLLGFLFQLVVGGLLFVLPVFLQSALYLNALQTGIVLLPYTLGIFIFALFSSRLPARFSTVRLVQAGLLLMLVGAIWVRFIASLELEWAAFVPALFCFGAGAGIVLSRLTGLTLSTIKPAQLGEAAGGDSTGKELGVAFGVSVLGSVFLFMMFGNVVDNYDAFYRLPVAEEQARAQAIIELEDWAARLTQEEWLAFLQSLPEAVGKAYESIVINAYLTSYKKTIEILIALIAGMLAISFVIRTRVVK
jgi:MFS family permease